MASTMCDPVPRHVRLIALQANSHTVQALEPKVTQPFWRVNNCHSGSSGCGAVPSSSSVASPRAATNPAAVLVRFPAVV